MAGAGDDWSVEKRRNRRALPQSDYVDVGWGRTWFCGVLLFLGWRVFVSEVKNVNKPRALVQGPRKTEKERKINRKKNTKELLMK